MIEVLTFVPWTTPVPTALVPDTTPEPTALIPELIPLVRLPKKPLPPLPASSRHASPIIHPYPQNQQELKVSIYNAWRVTNMGGLLIFC